MLCSLCVHNVFGCLTFLLLSDPSSSLESSPLLVSVVVYLKGKISTSAIAGLKECLWQLKEQRRRMNSEIKGYQTIQWEKKQVAKQYKTA